MINNPNNILISNLSHNHITGALSDITGGLTELVVLDLAGNQIVGGLADTLGTLTSLKVLDLSDNFIVGELTDSVLDLNLSVLYVFLIMMIFWKKKDINLSI